MTTKVLYISYDGLTDPLGQSQILPYLKGLSHKGYQIMILSCEKKENFDENENIIRKHIQESNLKWEYIFYSKIPPILSTLWDLLRMKRKAFALHHKNNFTIVHCRSYIASLIGLEMKERFKILPFGEDFKGAVKFVFDMRGFWADERVEGGLWNMKNLLYKLIYKDFKKKETKFLSNADYTISLTEKAKRIIHSWKHLANQPIPIQVIPCCVDTEHFSKDKINKQRLNKLSQKLDINENDFVLSYLGSIGTWYMLDEMLDFFSHLLKIKNNAKFLFITSEKKEFILSSAKKKNIPTQKIIVQRAAYSEVPEYLSVSAVSIFFIKPCFSKKASSPTKQGEVISMGIPIICNSSIGDTDEIIQNNNCGIVINHFTSEEYRKAITEMDDLLKFSPENIRSIALNYFSLEKGIEHYDFVYKTVHNKE